MAPLCRVLSARNAPQNTQRAKSPPKHSFMFKSISSESAAGLSETGSVVLRRANQAFWADSALPVLSGVGPGRSVRFTRVSR